MYQTLQEVLILYYFTLCSKLSCDMSTECVHFTDMEAKAYINNLARSHSQYIVEPGSELRSLSLVLCVYKPYFFLSHILTYWKRKIRFFFVCLFLFFGFFVFLGPHTQHIWRFPGQGSNQSCCCWPTPQQRQIQATSVSYTIAHSNTRSLTH